MNALKQSGISSVLLAALIYSGFWLGLMAVTGTTVPLYAVVSQSMVPTLNQWDLIVIRNVDARSLVVGDIIVFHSPWSYDEFIVHRIVRVEDGSGLAFVTKGDNNPFPDGWGPVPAENLIGKVVFSVAYIGFLPLFLRSPLGIAFMATLFVVLFLMELADWRNQRQREKKEAQSGEKRTPEAQ